MFRAAHSALLAVAFGTLIAACGAGAASSAPASSPSSSAAPAAELKKPGEAKVGDRTKCPVGGEEFLVSESSPKAEFEGKTYYFCCAPCVEKFKADPKKYLTAQ